MKISVNGDKWILPINQSIDLNHSAISQQICKLFLNVKKQPGKKKVASEIVQNCLSVVFQSAIKL